MKKVIAFLSLALMLTIGLSNVVFAQDNQPAATEKTDTAAAVQADSTAPAPAETPAPAAPESKSFHQVLKSKFIEGGAGWMAPILICFILGLA